jgi:RNA polymerase sigma factor (sigma-70 family)
LSGRDKPIGALRASSQNQMRNDDQLIAAIRGRDMAAFEELYRNYHSRLTRFLHNFLRRPQAIEEVLNDTLMVVWDRADSFNGASKLSTWIFAIAYRKAMKAARRQDMPIEGPDLDSRESEDAPPDERLGLQKIHTLLLEAMKQLSAEHRAVVDFTYFHDMGYREIAEIMDCPVDTVKTRMFHARRHLRRHLGGSLSDWI